MIKLLKTIICDTRSHLNVNEMDVLIGQIHTHICILFFMKIFKEATQKVASSKDACFFGDFFIAFSIFY